MKVGLLVLLGTACNALIGAHDIYLDDGTAHESDIHTGDAQAVDASSDPVVRPPQGACDADVRTSAANCGACGHDCSNGKCEAGLCILARDLPGPTALAVRDGTTYVTLTDIPDGIVRCASTGCYTSGPTYLTPLPLENTTLLALVVDDTNVYAAEGYSFGVGGVLRVGRDGTGYERLTASGVTRSLTIAQDSSTIYFAGYDDGAIYYCAKPSCAGGIKTATTAPSPALVAVASSGALVWAEGDGVAMKRCDSKTACTPTTLTTFTGYVKSIEIVGSTVYWGTTKGSILSCPISGCLQPSVVFHGNEYVTTISTDGSDLYWASMGVDDAGDLSDEDGSIHHCALPSCDDTARVLAMKQRGPTQIALDPASVYWVNAGLYNRVNGVGNVVKAPR